MTPEDIREIIEQNKSLKDQLASLSITHAKDRQRLDEWLSDHIRDKKAIADALGTDPVHWDMKREVETLKREAAKWRAEHVTDAQRAYQNGEHE